MNEDCILERKRYYIRYFKGQNIVLINREPTAFDYKASLIFRESIGEVLQTAVESI